MFSTTEVRWFYKGSIPPKTLAWFASSERTPEIQTPRTDLYLRIVDTDSLSIKLREGRIEVKQRQRHYGIARFDERVAGAVESWGKWSFSLAVAGSLTGFLAHSTAWVGVHKERSLRQYAITTDREVLAVPANEWPSQGCSLELTKVRIEGEPWWSLAFETFGDQADQRENLDFVIEHLLVQAQMPALKAANSCGYPRWLQMEAAS